jgi:tripartite-type tricarboxylate transporter receptor subunit TctC
MRANPKRSLLEMVHRSLLGIGLMGIAVTTFAMIPGQALAEFPERPIKMIVANAPGGATDITARIVAEHMSKTLKQQIIIENQGGGGGTIAFGTIARSKPDGYSLAIATGALTGGGILYSNLPYDTEKSFAPVSLLATFYNIFVTHPGFQAKTLSEFIAYAKTKEVMLGSGNVGGMSWLSTMKLNRVAGTKVKYIPYKGLGPAVVDLVGGHIDMALGDLAGLKQLMAAGKILPVAVTSPKRAAGLPNVPAMSEAVPGFGQEGWIGLLAPAGTPKDVIQKLNKAAVAALADPTIRGRLIADDFGVIGNSPEEFADFIHKDVADVGATVKFTGVKLDIPK